MDSPGCRLRSGKKLHQNENLQRRVHNRKKDNANLVVIEPYFDKIAELNENTGSTNITSALSDVSAALATEETSTASSRRSVFLSDELDKLTLASSNNVDDDLLSSSDDSIVSNDDIDSDDDYLDEEEAMRMIEKLNELSKSGDLNAWIIVKSKHNKDKLCSSGYFYTLDKDKTLKREVSADGSPIQRQYWKCEQPSCAGRGNSDFWSPPFTITKAHNDKICQPSMAKQELYLRIDRLKELASTSGYNPRKIQSNTY
jgi:hypothetical protein